PTRRSSDLSISGTSGFVVFTGPTTWARRASRFSSATSNTSDYITRGRIASTNHALWPEARSVLCGTGLWDLPIEHGAPRFGDDSLVGRPPFNGFSRFLTSSSFPTEATNALASDSKLVCGA